MDCGSRADAVAILAEGYRYRSGGRIAANRQGFSGRLVALASTYNVDLDWSRRSGGARACQGSPAAVGNASGSGVAIDRHHILSNAHVVEEAALITVLLGGRAVATDVVFADQRNDLALLHVETLHPSAARFRPTLNLHLGEDIVVLDFPL